MFILENLWRSAGDEGAPPPEETVPEGAEDGGEDAVETSYSAPEEAPPSLETIPDEIKELVRQQVELESKKRVGEAESGWTQKFQTQKQRLEELEQYERTVRDFDRRLQEEPEAILSAIQQQVQQRSRQAVTDPGDPPDPMDYEAYTSWVSRDRAYRNHLLERAVQQQQQQMAPVMDLVRERQQSAQIAKTAQILQMPVEKVQAAFQLVQELQKNPEQAWRDFIALTELKSKQATQRKNLGGAEERPGPSRTSVRKPVPKATGDLVADTLAELEAEGIKYPEGQ